MRVGSVRTSAPPLTRKSWKPYAETIVKSADPTPTSRCVRRPASRSRSSRSIPTAPPSTAARNSRSRASSHGNDGIAALSKRSLEHGVLQIRDAHDARRAQRAADQPLDLDGPPLLLAARRLALGALARRGRQQRVLGRDPAAPLPVEPARDAVLHGRRTEHLRLSLAEEHGGVGLLEEVELDLDRAELVRAAAVCARQASTASSSSSVTCSTSSIGNRRKRRPCTRNASGSPVVRKRYDPSRSASFSNRLRRSVSSTSRAVSTAEKTSVTSRPKTRLTIGSISG